jgi:hypothetical protein
MSNNIKYLICLNLGPADGPILVDIIRNARGHFPELAAVHDIDQEVFTSWRNPRIPMAFYDAHQVHDFDLQD